MDSSNYTARSTSNVILMFPSKKSPARTSTTTRVNQLWTAMLDLNAAPRGTEQQDSIDYRIPIDMVSEMRGMLDIARENDLELFDDLCCPEPRACPRPSVNWRSITLDLGASSGILTPTWRPVGECR